jgi:hypothetical protein
MTEADVDARLAEVLRLLDRILKRGGSQDSTHGEGNA